jgi:hypothetical protein
MDFRQPTRSGGAFYQTVPFGRFPGNITIPASSDWPTGNGVGDAEALSASDNIDIDIYQRGIRTGRCLGRRARFPD